LPPHISLGLPAHATLQLLSLAGTVLNWLSQKH
jgi:hypothetical protein